MKTIKEQADELVQEHNQVFINSLVRQYDYAKGHGVKLNGSINNLILKRVNNPSKQVVINAIITTNRMIDEHVCGEVNVSRYKELHSILEELKSRLK